MNPDSYRDSEGGWSGFRLTEMVMTLDFGCSVGVEVEGVVV